MTTIGVVCAAGITLFGWALGRIRGGWLNDWVREHIWHGFSNVAARLTFCTALTAIPVLITNNLWLWTALPLWYLGTVFGWFGSADIGRDKDRGRVAEMFVMTGRGLLWTTVPAVAFVLLGYGPWFAFVGAPLGLLYELAHRTPSSIPNFNSGMELGEAYFGAYLFAATFLFFVVSGV